MEKEYCESCEHHIDLHYKSVRNVIVCSHIETGTSTSGVIGIPYTNKCDCKNYNSKMKEEDKARRIKKNEETIEYFKKRIESNPAVQKLTQNIKEKIKSAKKHI